MILKEDDNKSEDEKPSVDMETVDNTTTPSVSRMFCLSSIVPCIDCINMVSILRYHSIQLLQTNQSI